MLSRTDAESMIHDMIHDMVLCTRYDTRLTIGTLVSLPLSR